MRQGVVIYNDWAPLLKRLPDALRGRVFSAVLEYSETGERTETGDPAADMLLAMMYQQIERDLQKYEDKAESVSEARREAGRVGALKRWQKIANDSKNSKCHLPIANDSKNSYNTNTNTNKANALKEKDTLTRIEKESAATAVAPTRAQTRYERFLDWLKAECPYIAQHYKLPSEELFTKLLDKYGGEAIAEQCANIENRADIRKRYTNLYQTLNNWLKRENNGNNKDDNAESSREQRAAAVADLITRLRAEDARAG